MSTLFHSPTEYEVKRSIYKEMLVSNPAIAEFIGSGNLTVAFRASIYKDAVAEALDLAVALCGVKDDLEQAYLERAVIEKRAQKANAQRLETQEALYADWLDREQIRADGEANQARLRKLEHFRDGATWMIAEVLPAGPWIKAGAIGFKIEPIFEYSTTITFKPWAEVKP